MIYAINFTLLLNATDQESEWIYKDDAGFNDALTRGKARDEYISRRTIDDFLEKKYIHIIARSNPEYAKEVNARPYTEEERLYLASPENAMTPEEYWRAHPEDAEEE